jgi:hypothetical protein
MPVAPGKIDFKIKNRNKTLDLINEGEVNILKSPGLTEISMEVLIPATEDPWADYIDGFKPVQYYLSKFKKLKTGKKSFSLVVTRMFPDSVGLHGTSIVVSLEDYDISDNVDEGFDTKVSLKFKQFVKYGTQKLPPGKKKSSKTTTTTTTTVTKSGKDRKTKTPKATTYTVKKGDCLWNISKKFLGNGARWKEIYNLNKSLIKNPNLIYPGQKFKIPA